METFTPKEVSVKAELLWKGYGVLKVAMGVLGDTMGVPEVVMDDPGVAMGVPVEWS